MWLEAIRYILSRPWIIVIFVMTIAIGTQWVNIQSLQGDILDLDKKIVKIEQRYDVCKTNVDTVKSALQVCNLETSQFIQLIRDTEAQVVYEKDRVEYWRNKYINKECFTPEQEVCVNSDEVEVLNEEANIDAINRINTIFK